MSQLQRNTSLESTCSVLSCTSKDFFDFFDGDLNTDILANDAINKIINPTKQRLIDAVIIPNTTPRYDLYKLLTAMITHAPDPLGKRYVAVALHIAHQKGADDVVGIAKAWLEHLFLPMLAISIHDKTEPSGSQTPTLDATVQVIEFADRSEQAELRKRVAEREDYRCAVTGALDKARVKELEMLQRVEEIPHAPAHARMQAAHIIPLSLDNFQDGSKKAKSGLKLKDAARTWDMFQAWTSIDVKKLAGSKINLPENAIYMTMEEHFDFGAFTFYFDKDEYPDSPHKYKVKMVRDTNVEFATKPSASPPDPEFLRIHAAFAKVLHLSGAASYYEDVERSAREEGTLRLDGKTDFGLLLRSRLILTH
ncbi:hypothetical protein CPB83DRAFT_833263 [Crepidotus variabilis]|uniref:HNH nuclease domain-containing protein n=1 Tax=Crepidotus variabilis TaxID=179855 RepID=A0A9P6EMH3_9AGAR|nr:hypothetical protein CPB83DRAFT_833263 [Crepidotus variabilis]